MLEIAKKMYYGSCVSFYLIAKYSKSNRPTIPTCRAWPQVYVKHYKNVSGLDVRKTKLLRKSHNIV